MHNKQQRAEQCRDRIITLAKRIENDFLEVGKLLYEAKRNHYYKGFGFDNLKDWLLSGQLGISYQTGLQLLRVVSRAKEYGVSDAQIRSIGVTKAALVLAAPATDIPALLAVAPTQTLSQLTSSSKELCSISNYRSVTFAGLTSAEQEKVDRAVREAKACVGTHCTNAQAIMYIVGVFMKAQVIIPEKRKRVA